MPDDNSHRRHSDDNTPWRPRSRDARGITPRGAPPGRGGIPRGASPGRGGTPRGASGGAPPGRDGTPRGASFIADDSFPNISISESMLQGFGRDDGKFKPPCIEYSFHESSLKFTQIYAGTHTSMHLIDDKINIVIK